MKSVIAGCFIVMAFLVSPAQAQSSDAPYRCKRIVQTKLRNSCSTTTLNGIAATETVDCISNGYYSRITKLPTENNLPELAKAECALELNKDIDELCGYNKNTGSITINVRVYNADLKKPPFQTFGFRKKYDCAAPPTITSSDLKKILGG